MKERDIRCPLCNKEFNIFEVSMESCSGNKFHYVCHGCVRRLVTIALDLFHSQQSVLPGEFTFVHRDLKGNITNKEKFLLTEDQYKAAVVKEAYRWPLDSWPSKLLLHSLAVD